MVLLNVHGDYIKLWSPSVQALLVYTGVINLSVPPSSSVLPARHPVRPGQGSVLQAAHTLPQPGREPCPAPHNHVPSAATQPGSGEEGHRANSQDPPRGDQRIVDDEGTARLPHREIT